MRGIFSLSLIVLGLCFIFEVSADDSWPTAQQCGEASAMAVYDPAWTESLECIQNLCLFSAESVESEAECADALSVDVSNKGIDEYFWRLIYLFNPIRVKVASQLSKENLHELVNALIAQAGTPELLKVGVNTAFHKKKINGTTAKIFLYHNERGRMERAINIKISTRDEKLYVKNYIRSAHFVKRLDKKNLEGLDGARRGHLKESLKRSIENALSQVH